MNSEGNSRPGLCLPNCLSDKPALDTRQGPRGEGGAFCPGNTEQAESGTQGKQGLQRAGVFLPVEGLQSVKNVREARRDDVGLCRSSGSLVRTDTPCSLSD